MKCKYEKKYNGMMINPLIKKTLNTLFNIIDKLKNYKNNIDINDILNLWFNGYRNQVSEEKDYGEGKEKRWTAHHVYFTFCLRIHTHSETAHNAGCRCASYVLNLADSK